jgi:enamine deaminase RidA (YjgF/YER057c/UK114 family)
LDRQRAASGSPYEPVIGFSRAVRVGNRVLVSGTGPVGADDGEPATQMRRCIEIVEQALGELGASLADVVRTRTYLTDPGDWEPIATAHGEAFGEARPAATMVVVAALLDPRWRVEIEAEAVVA